MTTPENDQAAPSGPRVTPQDIKAEIIGEHFFTARHGIAGALERGELFASERHPDFEESMAGLDRVTICVLSLSNGARVVGVNYGAIDPAQHSPERGREEARKQAVDKVYELVGFRVRDRLLRLVGCT